MTRIRRTTRSLAWAVALTVPLAGCGGDTAAQQEGPPSDSSSPEASGSPTEESGAAADWLAGQLQDGLLSYKTEYGPFTDYGLSVDAALALDRVGGHEEDVQAIGDAVTGQLTSYTEFPSGKGTHVSAGAVAKSLALAQTTGGESGDLVADLEQLTADSGRIQDTFPAANKKDADYANVIGQVFAARTLAEAGSAEATAATDYLLQQQCADGGFRLAFTADPDAADQSCEGDPKATPDADVTALAVVHLDVVAESDEQVRDALDEAAAWLAEQQEDDGSVAGGQPPSANANTTGLVGWALGEAGDEEGAAAAAGWVADLQLTDGADAGSVAFDAASSDADAGAVPPAARSQYLLATAQALPALLWYRS